MHDNSWYEFIKSPWSQAYLPWKRSGIAEVLNILSYVVLSSRKRGHCDVGFVTKDLNKSYKIYACEEDIMTLCCCIIYIPLCQWAKHVGYSSQSLIHSMVALKVMVVVAVQAQGASLPGVSCHHLVPACEPSMLSLVGRGTSMVTDDWWEQTPLPPWELLPLYECATKPDTGSITCDKIH